MGVSVLHVSDIHAAARPDALVYGRQAGANLKGVVDAARARQPRFDVVAVTGDVADDASPIERLDAELDEAEGSPCAVLVHHPPRPPCTDPDCQIADPRPVLDVIDRHPDVRVVLSGHLHRSFSRVRGGTCWIGAPSTCMQIEHADHTTAERPAAHAIELGDDGSVLLTPFHA
jgi:3',5'-cyclic AMP phosphodiesterase CpdA